MAVWVTTHLVSGHAYLGRYDEAHRLITKLATLRPHISPLPYAAREPFRYPIDLEHLKDCLRKAGLPD
jgi:hypothetical protein